MVTPDYLGGDEWTRITGMFNLSFGQGEYRVQVDILSKWMELKNEITWFNRWCHHLKNSSNYYYSNEEALLEMVLDLYIFKHEGKDF